VVSEDRYEWYEAVYGEAERTARRDRPKSRRDRMEAELADVTEQEGDFQMTYEPARHEAWWLPSSLAAFYQQNLITDVLARVKGGKEANVYRCAAHPATGYELLAAKVYRPRQFRNLRNDRMYREGRPILTAEGRPAKSTDHRLLRAVGKKTEFGVQVQHTSWLMYEYTTLERLYQAGASVPQPVGASDNAVLMDFRGDADRAAPTLSEVRIAPDEAPALFAEVLRNIELMLQHGLIHGDLSAYNILYWNGGITLIDFPQVTDCRTNRNARTILQRDIARVCDHFSRLGVPSDREQILEKLWACYAPDVPED
jgi:RIO kinase 1